MRLLIFRGKSDRTSYFIRKTDELLQNGETNVIWIFTNNQKFLIAENGTFWVMDSWPKNIEIMDCLPTMNIKKMMTDF